MVVRVALLLMVLLSGASRAGAGPTAETVDAWNAYVKATEARIAVEVSGDRFLAAAASAHGNLSRQARQHGRPLVTAWHTPGVAAKDLPGGQVHHWLGVVFVSGVTLDEVLQRVRGTDIQSRQSDVLAARVLRDDGDEQTVYVRLRRSQVVTVTYDTEHRVHFRRLSADRGMSTSVATRIVELEGDGRADEGTADDRGFLWRLNAYWRYQAVPGGVLVECESLSLSRSTPFGLGPLVGPYITRVARESMERTLRAVLASFGS